MEAPVIRLVSCLGVALDLPMLPHFLRHYADLGIPPGRMHLILNAEEPENQALEDAAQILAQFGTAPARRWIGPYTSDAMWAQRRKLQTDICIPTDWVVNADIDEHYTFPAPIGEIIAHCVDVGATCVQGVQIDRFAPGGALAQVQEAPPLAKQFPIAGEASFHIFGGGPNHGISSTTKLMLHRADILPRRGGHNPEGLTADSAGPASQDGPRFLVGQPLHRMKRLADPSFRFAFPFQSAHYKWSDARLPTIERRLATPGVSAAGQEIGDKVRAYLGKHGHISLTDVALMPEDADPFINWQQRMADLRAGAAGQAGNPKTIRDEIFIVIRAAGERTEAACHARAVAETSARQVGTVREVPFSAAIKKAFELGVEANAKWTLCLDADVLLRPGAVQDLLAEAKAQDSAVFGVSGLVADRLLGQYRVAGQHLYRTSLMGKALKQVDFDQIKQRPESYIKRQMSRRGHDWVRVETRVGLHDFEQSYADVFRKTVVHAHKHSRFVPYLERFWARASHENPGHADDADDSGDFRVALSSLRSPERLGRLPAGTASGDSRIMPIDRSAFPTNVDGFLNTEQMSEKPPLAADAIRSDEISARLATFTEAPEWLADRPLIEAEHGSQDVGTIRLRAPRSDVSRTSETIRLISCIGVGGPDGGDLPILPHFLEHFGRLGIDPARMHLILNAPDGDSAALSTAKAIIEDQGLPSPEIWVGPYTSAGMWDRRRTLQQSIATSVDWIVNADADEFHRYPATLTEIIAHCRDRDVACIQGPFIDRIAANGNLPAVISGKPLRSQFPISADIGAAIGKRPGVADATGTVKVMLHRGDILPGLGGHNPQNAPPEQLLYGYPLGLFPRIKSASWRFALPFTVDHYKWTAGLMARLRDRRGTAGASAAGSTYGGRILDYLEGNDNRISLNQFAVASPANRNSTAWPVRVNELSEVGASLRTVRRRVTRQKKASAAMTETVPAGWKVRQLTFGSGAGMYHAHSYYDIPVLDEDAKRIAAYRMGIEGRWMTPEDKVEVGFVDADRGGFHPIGTSRAWSWQQGPMAQWLAEGRGIVWNDRLMGDEEGDRFIARIHDLGTARTHRLDRPVYALDPGGRFALSLNMARLDRARPGYGYVGGRGAQLDQGAPDNDGIWKIDLTTREEKLILPLSRAVAFLADHLPESERPDHLSGALVHWFNHAKVAPDGRRFTVKLRWRAADLQSRWTGHMGVSLTCGTDGTDLAMLARGTSHVIWDEADRLYFWHQAESEFATMRDAIPRGTDRQVPYPDLITANVHFRHFPEAPHLAVYDKPYAEDVDIMLLDRETGDAERLVRFSGHEPPKGPFRCDLHPVPSPDGARIVVTSLQDGGRQIYVIEREGSE